MPRQLHAPFILGWASEFWGSHVEIRLAVSQGAAERTVQWNRWGTAAEQEAAECVYGTMHFSAYRLTRRTASPYERHGGCASIHGGISRPYPRYRKRFRTPCFCMAWWVLRMIFDASASNLHDTNGGPLHLPKYRVILVPTERQGNPYVVKQIRKLDETTCP